jgi:HPt (histidine-containing phosphotransfer) domain-containing protein
MAAGIHRVAGSKSVYRDLLIQFRDNHHTIYEEIRQAIAESRLDHAGHLIHTLKGISGNLGASGLHDAAGGLESALKEGRPGEAKQKMALFKTALDQVFDSIRRLDAAAAQKTIQTAGYTIAPEDLRRAKSVLSECSRLLRSDFAESMKRMEILKALFKDTPMAVLMRKLEKHMNAFNIEKAQAVIAAIGKDLRAFE